MGWIRFAIAFDLHGSEQHEPTVRAFHRFCDDFNPQRKIIGGDVWDFAALRKDADKDDLGKSITKDFDAGLKFIERFKPDTILLGNHDARLWRVAERSGGGPTADLAILLRGRVEGAAKRLRCRLLPYGKRTVLRLGPLNVLHGNSAGESACKRHAQIYGPAIFGHVHTGEFASVPSLDHRLEAWSSPCLSTLNPSYAAGKPGTLKWVNGWMWGYYKGRSYHVETARSVGREIVVATGFKVLAA